jgi:multidrug transporter EmrE-like cation transporter
MTRFAWVFLLLTVLLTVAGQLMVKRGMLQVGSSPEQLNLVPGFVYRAMTNPSVVIGMGCAVGAAISWTIAIARADLSFAYPFMALSIVLVLALSGLLFDEVVSFQRWIGVAVVCLGLVLASRS